MIGGAATHPYAATWLGNIPALRTSRGVLSAHKRPELAVKACIRQRDALRSLWGSDAPWWVFQVIDTRDGAVFAFVH